MELDDPLRDSLVLLLTTAPQDGHAIMRAMADAGIATQLCTAADLSREVRAGVGAIVLLEEAMSKTIVRELATVIEEQVIWSDIPLIILTTPKRDASAHWRLIQNAPSIRNATFLERPMRIATLLQAVKVALRGREKQYRLRDQMREREQLLAHSEQNERRLSAVLNNTRMAVFFMDERQHCTYMNAAAENLTGYSLVETQGRSLHDMVHHTYPDGSPIRYTNVRSTEPFPRTPRPRARRYSSTRTGTFSRRLHRKPDPAGGGCGGNGGRGS
jgi:PAS domain S-box-containing protein